MFDINRAEKEALNNVNTLIAIRTLELKMYVKDQLAEIYKNAEERYAAAAGETKERFAKLEQEIDEIIER